MTQLLWFQQGTLEAGWFILVIILGPPSQPEVSPDPLMAYSGSCNDHRYALPMSKAQLEPALEFIWKQKRLGVTHWIQPSFAVSIRRPVPDLQFPLAYPSSLASGISASLPLFRPDPTLQPCYPAPTEWPPVQKFISLRKLPFLLSALCPPNTGSPSLK